MSNSPPTQKLPGICPHGSYAGARPLLLPRLASCALLPLGSSKVQSHDYTLDAMECDAYMGQPPRPPKDAPNFVVILLDDLGFAQFGCYGSDISTPAIDRLAAGGLRYNRFHVTALCSPTRAAVLTCI
jgi:hypothetical protein